MIEFVVVMKILTCLAAVILSCSIVSRDPGLRINRLMAVVPALIALWAGGELVSNMQPSAAQAELWVRATGGALLLLGPACLHIFAELAGSRRPMAARLLPISYAASSLAVGLHVTIGWGLGAVEPVAWGYAFGLEPKFAVLFATLIAPIAYVLVCSGSILPQSQSETERKGWRKLYAAIVAVVAVATTIDVVLPALGIRMPPMGSSCVIVVAYGSVIQFRRYGYALMSPDTFAKQILDTLNDGVVMLRLNGEIRSANAAFQRLVDADIGAILNSQFSRFVPELEKDLSTLESNFECELHAYSGAVTPIQISLTQLFNPSGAFCGVALLIRDLREVSELRGSLVASDRLATVGGLSAGISDEIREPIHEMRSHLEGIRMRLGALNDAVGECTSQEKLSMLVNDREELLDECLEGIDRIDAIVRDVRGFASGITGPVELTDLNTLISDALRIVRARVGDDIRVEKQFDELIPVPCVPGEIVQVLVNLLVNAIHATGDTGRVQVSSWQHEHEIWICIEDNGYGVPRDVITRIFDPFFTTKVVGDGTGLGLAISHHIVRNHGGDLRVESEEGRGARFTLLLPVDPELPCTESAVSMLLSR